MVSYRKWIYYKLSMSNWIIKLGFLYQMSSLHLSLDQCFSSHWSNFSSVYDVRLDHDWIIIRANLRPLHSHYTHEFQKVIFYYPYYVHHRLAWVQDCSDMVGSTTVDCSVEPWFDISFLKTPPSKKRQHLNSNTSYYK